MIASFATSSALVMKVFEESRNFAAKSIAQARKK